MNKLLTFLNIVLEAVVKENSEMNNKKLSVIEELEKLEIELADKIADAERWGDLNDPSNWRTAEVKRIQLRIEAKNRILDKLKG